MMSGKNRTSIIELCNQNGIKIQQIVTCIRLQQLNLYQSRTSERYIKLLLYAVQKKNCAAGKKIFWPPRSETKSSKSFFFFFFPTRIIMLATYNVILHIIGFKDSYSCKPVLFFFVGSGTFIYSNSLFHATIEKISGFC